MSMPSLPAAAMNSMPEPSIASCSSWEPSGPPYEAFAIRIPNDLA